MTEPSPIRGYRYLVGALDLVRNKPDPADEGIGRFIDQTRDMNIEALQEIRNALDADAIYTLFTFSRRQSAYALRNGDLAAATRAVDALVLTTLERIDFRDLNVDLPLFAVRELGGDVHACVDQAIRRCEPGTARHFAAKRDRLLSLKSCALVEVSSAHGVGFMEAWTRTADPSADLASAAVNLADLIDAEGSYRIGNMHAGDLPEVWFDTSYPVGQIATRGCIGLAGDHVSATAPFSHGLLVFVAELESKRHARSLVDKAQTASTDDRPRSAVQHDDFVVVFIGGSTTSGETALETAESLDRFHPLALSALAPRTA